MKETMLIVIEFVFVFIVGFGVGYCCGKND